MRDYILIPNQRNVNIKITRGELCRLIIACSMIGDDCPDTRVYWKNLHDKLKEQLDDHDKIYGRNTKYEN